MTCLGIIPDSFIACGEGHGAERQFCSDVCMLRAALAPFAKAAADHGVRSASKDDLWVSLGVPSSAWVLAMKALESGAIPARPEPKCAGCGRGVYDCEALMALGGDVFVCEVCDEMAITWPEGSLP